MSKRCWRRARRRDIVPTDGVHERPSHSALKRAALFAGVRREHIRVVPSDAEYRMDLAALAGQIAEDRAEDLHPVTTWEDVRRMLDRVVQLGRDALAEP